MTGPTGADEEPQPPLSDDTPEGSEPTTWQPSDAGIDHDAPADADAAGVNDEAGEPDEEVNEGAATEPIPGAVVVASSRRGAAKAEPTAPRTPQDELAYIDDRTSKFYVAAIAVAFIGIFVIVLLFGKGSPTFPAKSFEPTEPPVPSASVEPSPSESPVVSPSPSVSPSASASQSPSASPSPSASASPTSSASSPSPSPSPSPSASSAPTSTLTPSPPPSPSPSPS